MSSYPSTRRRSPNGKQLASGQNPMVGPISCTATGTLAGVITLTFSEPVTVRGNITILRGTLAAPGVPLNQIGMVQVQTGPAVVQQTYAAPEAPFAAATNMFMPAGSINVRSFLGGVSASSGTFVPV